MPTSFADPSFLAGLAPARVHPSPADWRDTWIYFLLVDRFNNPDAPPHFLPYDAPEVRYQGGRFRGIEAQLPYLKDLGVGALWLSPVLKNPPEFQQFWGGYLIQDFLRVESRFCADPVAARNDPTVGDRELRSLIDAAHHHGLYVILDIVLNHTGNLFTYPGLGLGDEPPWTSAPEPYPVAWRDADLVPNPAWDDIAKVPAALADAGIWPAELRRNDYFRRRGGGDASPQYQGDFGGGLRELVTEYVKPDGTFPVRDILIRCYQYVIGKFDVDGYRIDTLQYVEPEFARIFGNAMREYAQSIGKRNFFTFGEVWQEDDEARIATFVGRDTAGDADVVGVDAALDFPIWRRLRDVARGFLAPAELAAHYDVRRQAERGIVSSHGEASRYFVTFLDNHDLNDRFYFFDGTGRYDDQHVLALSLLYTLQGIPCLYYGAEQGLHGRGAAREAVREALWGAAAPFDKGHKFWKAVRALSDLRRHEPALRYGRQYFRQISGDGVGFGHSPFPGGVVAFSRILNDRELVVVANTSIDSTQKVFVEVDRQLNPDGHAPRVLYSGLHANPKQAAAPGAVATRAGRATTQVTLGPMEAQVIG